MIHEKDTVPMGCGAYSFEKYEDGKAVLEANAHYYAGEADYRLVEMNEG